MEFTVVFLWMVALNLFKSTRAAPQFLILPKNPLRSEAGANVTLWWDYTMDVPLTLAQWGTVNDNNQLETIIAQRSGSSSVKYLSARFKDRAFVQGNAALHLIAVKESDNGRYGCELTFQGESEPILNITELIVSEVSTSVPSAGERTGDDDTKLEPVYAALIAVFFVLVVLVLIYLYTTRTRKRALLISKRISQNGPNMEMNVTNQGSHEDAKVSGFTSRELPHSPTGDYSVIPPILSNPTSTNDWEIPRDSLVFVKAIGKGAFGLVAKGMAQGIRGSNTNQLVAIKMLRENATDENRQDLLGELNTMKSLEQHKNVIQLLACVTKSDPVMIITEYAPYGDLLGYLRKSRGLHDTYYDDPDLKPASTLSSKQLFGFAWDIANGMEFLSSKKIVHRDLAARNVLVGDGGICKITDFGMARDVLKEDLYRRTASGRLPVKWTALESLVYGICTTMSEVWSYGIVMYEIFTIGGSPYPKIEARSLASLLQEGYRMPKPPHLDTKLYDVMKSCWNETPEKRPTFSSLRDTMKQMRSEKQIYVNLKDYDTSLYQVGEEQDA